MGYFLKDTSSLPKNLISLENNTSNFEKKVVHKGHTYKLQGAVHLSTKNRFIELLSLIGKIILGVSILPLFSSKYRHWVKDSFSMVKLSLSPVYKEGSIYIPEFNSINELNIFFKKNCVSRKKQFLNLLVKIKASKPEFYEKLLLSPIFGKINVEESENFGFWMGGDALIASILSKRHNLQNLFVCETMEAFAEHYSKFCTSDENGRRVFILPTIGSGWPDGQGKIEPPNFPQHQVPVCVEKTDGIIRVALLDNQPAQTGLNPSHINNKKLWEGWEGTSLQNVFNHNELVVRAMLQDPSNTKKIEFYIPSVKREFAGGCIIFALHDAVSFLRRENFFHVIEVNQTPLPINDHMTLHNIITLPPENMVSTQSQTVIQQYLNPNKPLTEETFPNKKNAKTPRTLKTSLTSKKWKKAGSKKINIHIALKHLKYIDLVLNTLDQVVQEKISEEDFFSMQKSCLLTSKSATPPKTTYQIN